MKVRLLRTLLRDVHSHRKPGTTARPAIAWRRLTLCWHRGRAQPNSTPLASSTPPRHAFHATTVNLRLAIASTLQASPMAAPAIPLALRSPAAATIVHVLVATTPAKAPALQHPGQARPAQRRWAIATHPADTPRLQTQTRVSDVVERIARQQRRLPPTIPLQTTRATKAPLVHSRAEAQRMSEPANRQPLPETPRARESRAAGHPRVQQPISGTPLLWPSLRPESEGVPDGSPGRAAINPAHDASASAPIASLAAIPTGGLPPAWREAVRATVQTSLDTERIAEDVLRKVEKRLRIERERRGL